MPREFTEGEQKIINDIFGAKAKPAAKKEDRVIAELTKLPPLEYEKRRQVAADELGVRMSALDQVVRKQQALSHDEASALPHWKVEPWADAVPGAELLVDIRKEFEKYILLPPGAADALIALGAARVDDRRWRHLAVSCPGLADQAMRQDQRAHRPMLPDAAL